MEKHAGTLALESTLGQGTRAIAVFPKEALAAEPAPDAIKSPRRAPALAA
jgi:hypothetical protein